MKGAGIKFVILVMIGMAVIGGCVVPGGDNKTETVGQNAPATPTTPTATSTPSNIPAWLDISKDWRDRVVGKLNLPSEGAGLKRTAGGDDQYDDDKLVVGDGVPEMMAGIQGDNIVLVVDNDFWKKYDGWAEQRLSNVNYGKSIGLFKEDFVEVASGIYYVKVPIDGNVQMNFVGTAQVKTPDELKDIPRIIYKKL